jgi:hypothetical protein
MEESEQRESRFAALNEQNIINLLENVETKNTKRQNNTAVKLIQTLSGREKTESGFRDVQL